MALIGWLDYLWVLLLLAMITAVQSQSDFCGGLVCQNGASCINTPQGDVICSCTAGFSGTQCETNIDDCVVPTLHVCQNNARCIDAVNGYTCDCLSGWEGTYCEKEKDECQPNPCQNGGICTDGFDGFSCNCSANFTGSTCSQDIDECSPPPGPCENGATCQNSVGGFSCSCIPGYIGSLCESEIDECASSPCYFGGQCVDLINNFRCNCTDGFVGSQCQGVVRQCQLADPCGENGICVEKPLGGYQCFCKPGYFGDQCQFVVDLCQPKPCQNGATCVNYGISYTCNCVPGYSGKNCEIDINECAEAPCQNNGTCSETVNGPDRYICSCQPGYEGTHCEIQKDLCQSNPCQNYQVCVGLLDNYRCECPIGKTGERCEIDVFDCRATPCTNGGTCSEGGGTFNCRCPSPFTDQTCSSSLDPCIPNPCLHQGQCYAANQSQFECVCTEGYVGDRCEGDIYDCLSNPCQNGGTCEEVLYSGSLDNQLSNTNTSNEDRVKFLCRCLPGFTGTLCEVDFLACMSNPCKNGGACISQGKEDFTCDCGEEWTGRQCENDINECLASSPICLNGGQCINFTPGFRCVCLQQWTGKRCESDIEDCSKLTCLNGGTCVEGIGQPSSCQCDTGYTGPTCSIALTNCEPNPCLNNAMCEDVNTTSGNGNTSDFRCQCLPGYTGKLCDANIDECTILQPCQNNATCLDAINGFLCQCQQGWTGLTCGQNIDDCTSEPCENGGTCVDKEAGFECQCVFGYTGPTCNYEVNECSYKPCRNGATCVDLLNGFICICPAGFSGFACETNIDDCASSPCVGSATCVDGINSFTCVCPPGFQGQLCDQDIPECSSSPCQNGGVCTEPQPAMFLCSCPPGVTGANCQVISTATFARMTPLTFTSALNSLARRSGTGSSPVRVRRDVTIVSTSIITQISFTFTTTVPDGILLVATGQSMFRAEEFSSGRQYLRWNYCLPDEKASAWNMGRPDANSSAGQPQHLALELRNSALLISASNGQQLLKDRIPLVQQDSGIYSHLVLVTLGLTNVDLSLDPNSCVTTNGDDRCLRTQLTFETEMQWNLNGPFHFGGVSEFSPYIRNIVEDVGGFVGCLGNLLINNRAVNLAEAVQFSSTSPSTIEVPNPGCATHSPCMASDCVNGGTCQDLWTNKTCLCLPGFVGPNCEIQNTANFEIDSMLHFEGNSLITNISFSLSAANSTGLILYTLTTDSLSLSLDSGQIRMHLVFYDMSRDLVIRVGKDLHLEDWIRVSVQFSGNRYSLTVASKTSEPLGSAQSTASSQLIVTGPLFLGTLHSHPAMDKWRNRGQPLPTEQSIKGCIQDLTVNGVDQDLSDSKPTTLGNDPPTARPGCQKEETCLVSPCVNQGLCLPTWEGPVCQCEESYTGENCSQASSTTFSGNSSYSVVQLDRTKFSFGDSGTIEFRTRQPVSTLMLLQFYNKDGTVGDFIEFRIYSSRLQVYSSISQETSESNTQVSDGQWHDLSWVRSRTMLNLLLDGNMMTLEANFNPFHFNLDNIVYVYVGARPFFPGNASTLVGYFKGCMRDLTFNNQTLDYTTSQPSQPGQIVQPVSLTSGCESEPVCAVNPCPANSYCVDEWNSYQCPCLEGWHGDNCQLSVDDCKNSSCLNNGLCIDGHLSYTCDCGQNFTGLQCETVLEACYENPCVTNNTETCVSINSTAYTCNCVPGYSGTLCETVIDNCKSSPCLNNAVCINSVNNFSCSCQPRFSGTLCEIEDFCFSQPCYNGGSCLPLSSGSNANSSNSVSPVTNVSVVERTETEDLPFTCQCVSPFIGSQCQSYDYCVNNLCQNNGSCELEANKYSCNCTSGFYGTYCEYQDFCSPKPCLNGGECRNNVDSYSCLCPFYHTGPNCETAINQCIYNVCFNGATCVFNQTSLLVTPPSSSSSSNSSSYCVCTEGYTGQNCETDINECESNPCMNNGTCRDSTSRFPSEDFFVGFKCMCVPGFSGDICDLEINECLPGPCLNGGVCEDLVNNYTCNCLDGFTGINCQEDTRGCRSSPCQNNAQCEGVGDNFTCVCLPGFTGFLCQDNIDDCVNNSCLNGATCEDRINGYVCNCLSGYSGQNCSSITDSCYSQPCFSGGVCSYRGVCSCVDVVIACGWHDEVCQTQRCQARPDCQVLSPSYLCNCSETGYTGSQCAQDQNECQFEPSPCLHGGVCVNIVGSYSCNCKATGYHGDTCQEDNDECGGDNPCFNGGNCTNTPGSYQCECPAEWSGDRCEQNKDDCETNPCLNGGRCLDQMGGYSCNCEGTGFEGDNCTINVDDCVNNRCENGGQCVDGVRQYTCVCDDTGYTGQFCQIPPSSCTPSPCQNNGTCTLTKNVVNCDCTNTGFQGNLCQTDVNECQGQDHGCQGESVCVNVVGSYYCNCGDLKTGQFCESALAQEQSGSSGLKEGGVAALIVLAFVIIIIVALVVVWQWQRRRKTQGRYKPAEAESQYNDRNISMNHLADRGERII